MSGLDLWRTGTFSAASSPASSPHMSPVRTRSKTGYAGLSNQGATCYMNSLLQTLFMTPEFRRAVYQWRFDPERFRTPATCIPYQLQLLFARMHLSDARAVETKNLTHSFGWGSNEVFQQNDIQELNRVLFDHLETAFQGTPQASVLKDLYQGAMHDQIECLECHNVTHREDLFLDMSLTIRGFRSIEESLDSFVRPDLLAGDNQYHCDACHKKVDALKGFRIKQFPYILTLQLKRFDYDPRNWQRVKLNDEVSFPRFLNVARWVSQAEGPAPFDKDALDTARRESAIHDSPPAAAQSPVPVPAHDAAKPAVGDGEELDGWELVSLTDAPLGAPEGSDDNDNDNDNDNDAPAPVDDDAPPPYMPADANEAPPAYDADCPEGGSVYELYAILIHSGSAIGGHYYAYIKAFDSDRWYNFNDSTVTPLSASEIAKTFGGQGTQGYTISRSANAYMLVYRKVDRQANLSSVDASLLPQELRDLVSAENVELEQLRQEYERQKNELRVSVVCGDATHAVVLNKTETLAEAHRKIYEAVGLEATGVAFEDTRLRDYHTTLKAPKDAYTGKELQTLDDLHFFNAKVLMVETRVPGAEWPVISADCMLMRVTKFLPETKTYGEAQTIYVTKSTTLREARALIAQVPGIGIPAEHVGLVHVSYTATRLTGEARTLYGDYHLYEGCNISVEHLEDPEGDESPIMDHFNETRNTITVHFNLLGESKATQQMRVLRTKTVLEFKELIAPFLGRAPGEFHLKHGYFCGSAFRSEAQTLQQAGVADGQSIKVVDGPPQDPETSTCKFVRFTREGVEDRLENLFEMSASLHDRVDDLRQRVADRMGVPADRLRIREKTGAKPSRILRCGRTVKENNAYLMAGREIAVEVLPEPEVLRDGEIVLNVRRWFADREVLEDKYDEIVVDRNAKLAELRAMIATRHDVPVEHVRVGKSWFYYNPAHDIMESMRFELPGSDEAQTLHMDPLFAKEGDLIVWKDDREKEPERRAVLLLPGPADAAGSNDTSYAPAARQSRTYPVRRERALKIYTDEEIEEREEARRKAQEERQAARAAQDASSSSSSSPSPSSSSTPGAPPTRPLLYDPLGLHSGSACASHARQRNLDALGVDTGVTLPAQARWHPPPRNAAPPTPPVQPAEPVDEEDLMSVD